MKQAIGIGIVIFATIIIVVVSILMRKTMVGYGNLGASDFFSFGFWFQFFLNPMVILILAILGFNFILHSASLYFLEVNTSVILNWVFIVPSFLLTVFLANKFLGETVSPSQYPAIYVLLLSTAISIYGGYLYFK